MYISIFLFFSFTIHVILLYIVASSIMFLWDLSVGICAATVSYAFLGDSFPFLFYPTLMC